MSVYLLTVAALALPLIAAGIVLRAQKRQQRALINPLTRSLRRPPGAQLARQLSGEQLEAAFGVVELFGPAFLPLIAGAIAKSLVPESIEIAVTGGFIIAILIWAFALRKLFRRMERIRKLRLGYECELAVGQELNLLMMDGFQVFHDVPGEGFNIDHVVVGPAGVFAVETKGKSKYVLDDGKNSKAFRVEVENSELRFPKSVDKTSIPQTVRQAKWLSSWLSSATGDVVRAQGVLVLPGWYIESKQRLRIPVLASGYIIRYFTGLETDKLSAESITRIVHQLDQQVRDVDPGELVRPLRPSKA